MTTTDKYQQMAELLALCLAINEQTEHAAFFEYSGHVDVLHVRIVESKRDYQTVIYQSGNDHYMCFDVWNKVKLQSHIEAIKNILTSILNGTYTKPEPESEEKEATETL